MGKYYWLKLHRDFFKRHDIKILESMENGKEYALFYLKLLLESIDHEGELRFSDTIPYNEKMLATITDTNIDIVKSALQALQALGMVKVLEDSTLYMEQVESLIGSNASNDNAERQRRFRERQKSKLVTENVTPALQNVTESVTENVTDSNESKSKSIEIDKEKEIEIEIELDTEKECYNARADKNVDNLVDKKVDKMSTEIDKDRYNTREDKPVKDKKPPKKSYGVYNNVKLTDEEYNRLCADYGQDKTGKAIDFFDAYIEEKGYKSKSHNLAMRRWVFDAINERKPQERKSYAEQAYNNSMNAIKAFMEE